MASENPYQAPRAQVRDHVEAGPAGGTLEDGIAGNYDFEIMEVIKEGWERQSGMKGAFWLGAILLYAVMIVLAIGAGLVGAMALGQPAGEPGAVSANQAIFQIVMQLVMALVMYPMYAGMAMIGINRSVDLPVKGTMVLGYFGFTIGIFFALMLMSVLTMIGFLLLIIPGIYLSIAYSMTMPLIVEKRLGVWAAMEASRRAVSKHWFKVFFVYMLMSLILMVSALPLFIGLIWTLPMMLAAYGVMYRTMFGVEQAREAEPVAHFAASPAQA
jgi:uncharacterized membrane protein